MVRRDEQAGLHGRVGHRRNPESCDFVMAPAGGSGHAIGLTQRCSYRKLEHLRARMSISGGTGRTEPCANSMARTAKTMMELRNDRELSG